MSIPVEESGSIASTEQNDVGRPVANFPPSVWGCSFAAFSVSSSEVESLSSMVADLKEKVNGMLANSTKDPLHNIVFIDLLERLGVSYHFQAEIEEQLSLIFDSLPHLLDDNDYDLYTCALLFRVLRQNGYRVHCDLFSKFTEVDGKFKEALKNDVRGILSLYEACHANLHGEDILEEGLAFAKASLEESLLALDSSQKHFSEHVRNALGWPFHRSSRRIEALKYISFYAEEECMDETLLNFAKVDFNYLQLLHRQELIMVSRWWKETQLGEKLLYARDRIVELYFWAMGARFEPKFSASRIAATKYAKFVSLVDDTYDAYGTPEELQLFTEAFDRCDISAAEGLPDYMKVLYKGFLELFDGAEDDMKKQGRGYSAHHAKEEFKKLVVAYHGEAKWKNADYTPTVSEYMQNGLASSSYGVITAAFFLGRAKSVGIKEYEWLQTNPTIDTASKLLGRLLDDIVSHEFEQKRGHCASGVECCMKERGLAKEAAVVEIRRICEDAWKDMNQEAMRRPTAVAAPVIQHFVDLVRIIAFIYGRKDSYTNSILLKDPITRFLLDPLPL